MTEKEKYKRGCVSDIVSYFVQHDGEVVTIAMLEQEFRGKWNRRQLLHALSPSTVRSGSNAVAKKIVKLQHGVWSLNLGNKPEVQDTPPLEVERPKKGQPKVDNLGEPENPDNGILVKARNGILYVDGMPADLEVFVMGLRIAVRVS